MAFFAGVFFAVLVAFLVGVAFLAGLAFLAVVFFAVVFFAVVFLAGFASACLGLVCLGLVLFAGDRCGLEVLVLGDLLLGRRLGGGPAPADHPASFAAAGGLGAAAALEILVGEPGDDDRDVAGALADPDAPPPGAGTPALERRARRRRRRAPTKSSSSGICSLCSAFAIAESRSLPTSWAADRSQKCSVSRAVSTS